jgi:hypothetical protein
MVSQATESELNQSMAIRFAPFQIVHFRIGDDRKTFYPYGQSLIEPARGPAHQLRLMEDAMVVYRLTRAPERRVFYVDVGQLPPFKAEAFIDRLKDQFRKRKTASNRGTGANQVEERWQPPPQPTKTTGSRSARSRRPESKPFRVPRTSEKLTTQFISEINCSPPSTSPRTTSPTKTPTAHGSPLSAQDVKFARMIERLQSHFEDGLLDIAERHLQLRGFPENSYDDLKIKMTPPSDWRELSRAEVVNGRYSNATTLKSGQLMADYDIMTRILKYNDEETEEMLSRLKIQKLEDLKLQVLAQNPQLLGIGIPGQDAQPGQKWAPKPGTGPQPGSRRRTTAAHTPDQGAPPAPPGAEGQPPRSSTSATAGRKSDTGTGSRRHQEVRPRNSRLRVRGRRRRYRLLSR